MTNKQKSVLILTGSPKQAGSVSGKVATSLAGFLDQKEIQTKTMSIFQTMTAQAKKKELLNHTDAADVIIIISPQYVDSLPYLVTKFLELLSHRRKNVQMTTCKQQLLAISHCGFAEAYQNNTTLAIYNSFAVETGFEWFGGLAFGMSPIVTFPLLNLLTYRIKKALRLTAEAFAEDKRLSTETAKLMAKPFMPIWLYKILGNITWLSLCIKNCAWKINHRPY